jgi:Xaa-Pro aminopeptidase
MPDWLDAKLEALRSVLRRHDARAALVGTTANFAWLTGGSSPEGLEIVTADPGWPTIEVRGPVAPLRRPDILCL